MTPDPFISIDDILGGAALTENSDAEPRCDFSPGKRAIVSISAHTAVITLWRQSLYGMTLSQIKQQDDLPDFFAANLAVLIKAVIGQALDKSLFVVVSPPKRRHPGKMNFASRMCRRIASELGIGYIDDFAVCRTRQRIDPDFSIAARIPPQKNIIVADDILTTGSTLAAMHDIIIRAGRNPILFAGIYNKH